MASTQSTWSDRLLKPDPLLVEREGTSTMTQACGTALNSTNRWLNIFQYCRFLRILGHVMVVIVLSLVSLIYTAVVPLTFGPNLLSKNVFVILGSAIVILLFTALVGGVYCRANGRGQAAAITARTEGQPPSRGCSVRASAQRNDACLHCLEPEDCDVDSHRTSSHVNRPLRARGPWSTTLAL